MACLCLSFGLAAGGTRLERGAAALALAREAHVKPSVWRRYRGDCRRFCVFRETEFGISGDVGPPFNLEHVLAWLGVMIAEKVDSAATTIAGLSKFQV